MGKQVDLRWPPHALLNKRAGGILLALGVNCRQMHDFAHPSESLPVENFAELAAQKAAGRQRDQADVASGRRTAAEVWQENSGWVVADPATLVFLNEYAVCEALQPD